MCSDLAPAEKPEEVPLDEVVNALHQSTISATSIDHINWRTHSDESNDG